MCCFFLSSTERWYTKIPLTRATVSKRKNHKNCFQTYQVEPYLLRIFSPFQKKRWNYFSSSSAFDSDNCDAVTVAVDIESFRTQQIFIWELIESAKMFALRFAAELFIVFVCICHLFSFKLCLEIKWNRISSKRNSSEHSKCQQF